MKLNAINIATLAPRKLPYGDSLVSGLALYIGPKRRTWQLRFRGAGGKQITEKLGFFIPNAPAGSDSLGLAAAREKAKARLLGIEAGCPAAAAPVQHPKEAGITVGQVIDAYELFRKNKAKGSEKKWQRGMKTLPAALKTVRRCLAAYLETPARSFSKANLRAVRDQIAKRAPTMSDRFLDYLGPIWKWASQEDKIEVDIVPSVLAVGPGLVKRDRVLTDEEIRAIWKACGEFERDSAQAFGRLVRFLLVTAQRKMEAAPLRHGRIIGGHWKQEADENKAGREHLLKLPALALQQIGQGKAQELCFANIRGNVLSGWNRHKQALDSASGVTGWRLHDLRRTAATRMQGAGVELATVDMVLNHAVQGVGAHYMHAAMNEQKAAALETWAVELSGILAQGKAKAAK